MLNEIYNFIREIAPVRMQVEWGAAVSIIGTVFCYLVGGWDGLIEALIIAMILDYISGVIAAYLNPDKKLNSQKGFAGILKKIMILLMVATAHFVDYATGQEVMIRSVVILFFLGNEGLSILENSANAGLPVPNGLKESLEQFTKNKMGGKQS